MSKGIAYIDGYNLYCGLMDGRYILKGDRSKYPLRKYLWLNLKTFLDSYLPKGTSLETVRYFTAPVKGNHERYLRQEKYLAALRTLDGIHIHQGKHIPGGKKYSEKQTDVKIALNMYNDALQNDDYTLILVSGDTDQIPTVKWIKRLGKNIKIFITFPPFRNQKELADLADESFSIRARKLRMHQFPDIIIHKGKEIEKPPEWS